MGISISYRPTSDKGIVVEGASGFRNALEECYGHMPFIIDKHSTEPLRGIAACGYRGANELIAAVKKHDEIEVDFSH